MITELVDLGDRSYPVIVGAGAIHELMSTMPVGIKRVAIVTQPNIPVLLDPDVESRVFHIEGGEPAKSLATVERLCEEFSDWGLTRRDIVIGVGGGLVTDVAGFAASVYHRGLPVIHVSTTLLGQIDAAIGGKTGVNLAAGKNLVGSYWQPHAVICDTELLLTLPEREYRSGLGEMAKYAFLGVENLASLPLEEAIAACIRCKADVVASDEREGGRRAILNYGHTLAHALETEGSYGLFHGEAVAVGIIYAAEVALRLGRINQARVQEHRDIVARYRLSGVIPIGLDPRRLLALFGRDKKAIDGVTFVLDGPEGVEPLLISDSALLLDAMEACRD